MNSILNHNVIYKDYGHLYSGRALGISDQTDVLQLHSCLQSEWEAIVAHYKAIGLKHTNNIIWDTSWSIFASYSDLNKSVYFFGTEQNKMYPDQRWLSVAEKMNSKNQFITLAKHLQCTIPKTLCFQNKIECKLKGLSYPCYIKAAISMSGEGIFYCRVESDAEKALDFYTNDMPFQIQEEIPAILFLNIQYYESNNAVYQLAITEQLLNGVCHQGNRYPAMCSPWESVQPLAEWMVNKGMKGVFAFDVVVTESGDIIVLECNPRYNTSTYPILIAFKLGITKWVCKEFITQHRNLGSLDLSGLEYNNKTGSGIVVVNWGLIQMGRIGVLIAGTIQDQIKIEEQLKIKL